MGQGEEGLNVLAEALALVDKNWGADLRGGAVSAKGELTLRSPESRVQSLEASLVPIPNPKPKQRPKLVF